MARRAVVSLALAAALCLAQTKDKAAYPLIPGLDFIASSLDANYLDVLSPTSLSPQYVKLPAVALSYTQNKTIYGLDGQLYAIPDQANAVTSNTNGICSQYSSFSQSSFNFSLGFLASFTVDADLTIPFIDLALGGALSFTAQLGIGFQTSSESAVGVAYCNATTHEISLDPAAVVNPDPEFAKGVTAYLSPNPRYEQNVQAWQQFFSNWGTVVPTGVQYGGVAGSIYQMSMSAFSSQFNGSVAAALNASAALASFIFASGGATVNGNMSTASSSFFKSTTNETVWRGGTCIPGTSGCSFDQWFQTVFAAPATLFIRYAPITDYLALVDKNVAAGSHDAIQNITAIAAMEGSAKPLLNAYKSLLSSVSIPPIEQCQAAPLSLAACQPNPLIAKSSTPGMCCTTATSGGFYPDDKTAAAIAAASATKTAQIEEALAAIDGASAKQWISLEGANNVTSTLTSSAIDWALQTKQAQCAVNFVPNNVCPDNCTPVQCGQGSCLLQEGGPCCLCPVTAVYEGCCDGGSGNDQIFLCPSQCSGAPGAVQTFTATWPTVFDPFYSK